MYAKLQSVAVAFTFFAIFIRSTVAQESPVSPAEFELVEAAESARMAAIEKVYGSVVAIYGNDRQGGGSGVIFDSAGYALTNYHVVSGAGLSGWAGLADGKLYRWKIVGIDPGGDVAIIDIDREKPFPISRLGDSSTVRVGDWSMAMGNPFLLAEDQRPTVTLGIVSGIERYQYGEGMNELVYGNCIQVDSSINPGNSGGPLYNLAGEVIGINGRGSFEERGRVNVGLGYAISINQIKNFLPDIMATKVAQHGSLDALFTNRREGVICSTINLDSPIATLGLQLGDRLVEFEGEPIRTANQFTNLMTTLPADWPAKVIVERAGERLTFHSRLLPLPYAAKQSAPKPPTEKKPIPTPETANGFGDPGGIRDAKQNQAIAGELLLKAQTSLGVWPEDVVAIRLQDEIQSDGETTPQTIVLAADGRFRIDQPQGAGVIAWGYDGKDYWRLGKDRVTETLSLSRALRDPIFTQGIVLAHLRHESPAAEIGTARLEGGDKAADQIAYRLRIVDSEGDWFHLWLSVVDNAGQPHVELLKSGTDADAPSERPALTWSDWRSPKGVRIPFRRIVVTGIEESPQQIIVTKEASGLNKIDDALFTHRGS